MTITLALTLPFILPIPAAQMPCPFQSPWSLFRISPLFLIADFPHCNPSSACFFSQKTSSLCEFTTVLFFLLWEFKYMHISRFPLGRFRKKKGLWWRRKGNKADGSFQRGEGGQVRAKRTLRGLGGSLEGRGPRHVMQKRAQGCTFGYKAIRVRANALKPSVLWKGTELCWGYRLSKALLASNSRLVCLRTRCGLGNGGQFLQIMKLRRPFHVPDQWWRGRLTLQLNLVWEVMCCWQDWLWPQNLSGTLMCLTVILLS